MEAEFKSVEAVWSGEGDGCWEVVGSQQVWQKIDSPNRDRTGDLGFIRPTL